MWIIVAIIVALFIACGGACAGCYLLSQAAVNKGTETIEIVSIANTAFTSVAADAAVQAKLGDSITLAGLPSRQGTGPLDFSNTVVLFDVIGPKGTATVTAHAKQENGAWHITKLSATYADGSTAEIAPPESTAPQLNF
jgi:hypothetical protein